MSELNDIGFKFGTDKSTISHNYLMQYEKYFFPMKNESIKLLEIGVQHGYSLKTWQEYFKNGQIYGLDINDCRQYEDDRIKIFVGSQIDFEFLDIINENFGPFDIVIDDASHYNPFTLMTFEYFVPKIKENGYYIVEDTHTCYWGDRDPNQFGNPPFTNRLKKLLDQINAYGKTGYGDRNKDGDLVTNFWEREIEFMHVYRSMAIIKRW